MTPNSDNFVDLTDANIPVLTCLKKTKNFVVLDISEVSGNFCFKPENCIIRSLCTKQPKVVFRGSLHFIDLTLNVIL